MTKATELKPANLTLDGGPLGSLAFAWLGDRYQHTWRYEGTDKSSTTLIASIESDGTSLWPVSPPLQQIHQQAFDDGREVIFGVGMSGRGHWSASFTLVPELRSWIVELACRSPLMPESLTSLYQLTGQWKASPNGTWERSIDQRLVRLEPIAPSTIGVIVDADQLRISPARPPAPPPSTTQWAFRLRWLN